MLILPIKKKWFDMIASGEKKEEYREIKPYWKTRFLNELKRTAFYNLSLYTVDIPIWVIFRNGYRKDSPTIKCECTISTGGGKPEWGAEPNKEYLILDIWEVYK